MLESLLQALERVEEETAPGPAINQNEQPAEQGHPRPHDIVSSNNDIGNGTVPNSPNVPLRAPMNTPMKASAVSFQPSNDRAPPSPHAEFDTSFTSLDATGSSFSTPAEIMLGPQSLPYIFHRRAATNSGDVSPTKAVFDPSKRNTSSPALLHASIVEPVIPPTEATSNRPHVELCPWRKEQLKYIKTPRLTNDGKVKHISAFHGPLSLPYARNPSGVDATVADDSAYLSNVFGLRALPTANEAKRNTSGTDSSRSTSDSSVVYIRQKAKEALQAAAAEAMAGPEVMVVRDLHQQIGLRKGHGQAMDTTKQSEGFPHPSTQPLQLNSEKGKLPLHPAKTVLDPSSAPFSTKASVRRALGTPLSPVPGSPSPAEVDPFKQLFEGIIKTVTDPGHEDELDEATIARLISTARYHINNDPSAWHLATPAGSRVVSNESAHSANQNDQSLPGKTPSKADTSEDWRSRSRKSAAFAETPAAVNTSPAQLSAATQHQPSPPRDVMTINDLLEKFGSPEQTSGGHIVRFRPPAQAESGSARASAAKSTPKSPLGEVHDNIEAEATPISERTISATPRPLQHVAVSRVASAKGTPGAGKLLRKSSGSEMADIVKVSSKLASVVEKENVGDAA